MHVIYPKPLKLLSLSSKQIVMLQHYLDTSYVLDSSPLGPPLSIRVGEACGELRARYKEVLGKGLMFVTAWNPASTPLSKSENANRHKSLLNDMARYFFVAGVGRSNNGEWYEESYTY